MRWWIGTSGFSYSEWRGVFYPPELPSRSWLEYYSREFSTGELNVAFYRTPRESTVRGWVASVGEGFRFALKMHRQVTHIKRLAGCRDALARFRDNACLLGDALGVVLIQLPPSLAFDAARLDEFLGVLPEGLPPLAWEVRHRSFAANAALEWFRSRGQTLVVVDSGGRYPTILAFTAAPAYLRFHGPAGLYASPYSEEQLGSYATWAHDSVPIDVPVYAFFNNDAGGHAITNARQLRALAASLDPHG